MNAVVPTAVPAADTPDLERATAEARVRWAVDIYGDGLVLTTSFGVQAAVMLHLVTRIAPSCACVMPCTTESPSPVPRPGSLVVKNGSKIRSRISVSIPWPLSVTERQA